jgi:hypothetical protein
MKFLLDFDRTLFDTDAFIAQVERDGRSDRLITPDIWQEYDVREFLYDDVLPWLATQPRESLHILTAITPTAGAEADAFQREKLRSGGFAELVASVTFVVGEKGEVAGEIASQFPPPEPIIFIDDRIEQCLSVQRALPEAHCCLMVREPAVIGSVAMVRGMTVVHSLAGVDAMIEKL